MPPGLLNEFNDLEYDPVEKKKNPKDIKTLHEGR